MIKATKKIRGFRLVVVPQGTDAYGLRLEQTNGGVDAPPVVLANIRVGDTALVSDSLHQALRESKQPKTVLTAGRRKPISLEEPAGVRLALALIAVEPIAKRGRREAILWGIAEMSEEEAYYWFAKATGPAGTRARRALRILLADDGRTGITA